jgi:putative ABC transport system permease protein
MKDFLVGVLGQSFIISIMVMGVYITNRFLNFPDLSIDGTFTLGASISAILISKGASPIVSLVIAIIGGFLAGSITGLLNVKLKIKDILSGILVMIGLYSINLRIMGRANLPLLNEKTIFTQGNNLITTLVFSFIVALLFTIFFKTKMGYMIKGVGDNEKMIISLGIDTDKVKILALAFSNGLVALAGGLMAQYQGFSDINMGTGTIIIGLASIVIGQTLFRKVKFLRESTLIILGTIIYRMSISLSLIAGFNPSDLKLISCIIVVLALTLGNKNIIFLNKKISFNFTKPISSYDSTRV